MKIECGDLVRDKVTGFQGIVTGVHRWITGCTTATVKPRELKDGKPIDGQAFDSPRLEVLAKGAVVLESTDPVDPRRTGGPKDHPVKPGC